MHGEARPERVIFNRKYVTHTCLFLKTSAQESHLGPPPGRPCHTPAGWPCPCTILLSGGGQSVVNMETCCDLNTVRPHFRRGYLNDVPHTTQPLHCTKLPRDMSSAPKNSVFFRLYTLPDRLLTDRSSTCMRAGPQKSQWSPLIAGE